MATPVTVLCFLFLASFAASSDDNLTFIILGDWGGKESTPYYTPAEKEIAEVMGQKATEVDAKFIMALGDNFYSHGVKDVSDQRFKSTFENVFTAPSLQIPWYVLCGNHDHYGNASAQVAYTKVSDRWNMPDLYYTKTFNVPGNVTLQIVNIDTVVLCGVSHPILRWLAPTGPMSVDNADEEWNWIETTLKQSTADWLIVAGHYPVWSIAEHGPTQTLVDKLRPLLIKYNVTAYFCGHDHSIQHIKESSSSVNYFVSGAAHLTDPSTSNKDKIPNDSLKFHYAPVDVLQNHGSYNTVSVNKNTMTVTFYDAKGKQIYTTNLNRTR